MTSTNYPESILAGSMRPGSTGIASPTVIASDIGRSAPYTSSNIHVAACSVVVQIGGSATSFTCQVQRSDIDPSSQAGPNWVPAAAALTGDAATGFNPVIYNEPTHGWWNISFSAIAGGSITASISGLKP